MKNNPLISVMMPVFNSQKYLAAAIESILFQTYSNFELLIINDGSTDRSGEIIRKYKDEFPNKIKIFNISKNIGAYNAVNIFFKKAKGTFIAIMDSDDIAHPQRFEKQIKFLQSHHKVIVVGTQANIIDKQGEIISRKKVPVENRDIHKHFAIIHPMIHPSCMIRRSLLPNKNNLYETDFGVNSDYYTFFNLLNYGEFANLNEPLLNYRIHMENSSLLNLKKYFWNTAKIRLIAMQKFNYNLKLFTILVIAFQALIVVLLPSAILLQVYLYIRVRNFTLFTDNNSSPVPLPEAIYDY